VSAALEDLKRMPGTTWTQFLYSDRFQPVGALLDDLRREAGIGFRSSLCSRVFYKVSVINHLIFFRRVDSCVDLNLYNYTATIELTVAIIVS
jgi:hypothetical protein